MKVTIHYRRPNNDFDGWKFVVEGNEEIKMQGMREDDFGLIWEHNVGEKDYFDFKIVNSKSELDPPGKSHNLKLKNGGKEFWYCAGDTNINNRPRYLDPAEMASKSGHFSEALDDLVSFPILTSRDGDAPPSRGVPQGGIQRTVDSAIRATLGRLPKHTDSSAFLAALNASFEVSQVQGHTVALWRPRSYVGQTELGGGVTGMQASLHLRAREALNAVIPLLEGLTPLRPDADPQEMDAAVSIVRAEFSAIVEELGMEGGPRANRVDHLFHILWHQQVNGVPRTPPTNGMVKYVAVAFGLTSDRINTVEEEQVYSHFQLLHDYIRTIFEDWNSFRDNHLGKDFGTTLVLLSNALQVVAESVESVESALDSVFVGGAERSVADFPTNDDKTMLVSELLDWITSFSTQEARELVQHGGRRAMRAIHTTSENLKKLVDKLVTELATHQGLPNGMRHPRVGYSLRELSAYLNRVSTLSENVEVPQLTP